MVVDSKSRKCKILGLCNPLLDISAHVELEFLEKYNLKPNNVILAGEEHKDLTKDLVQKYSVDYTAGGSAQNVMRVTAGILRRQNIDSQVIFAGCIGEDEFGKRMEAKAREDGVVTNYAIAKDGTPTGTCGVLLTDHGKNRSLCAFLGASQRFSEQHLIDNWKELVDGTDIIYISGFLIAVAPKSFHLLGEHIAEQADDSKRFCLNLSAPYVSEVFGKDIEQIIKYVDIVFGNDDEALAYSKFKNWNLTDPKEVAIKIASEDKTRAHIPRIVVVTQGERPIIVAHQNPVQLKLIPCKQLDDKEIIDTNGAGDSFCGGFLSQFVQGSSLDNCVEFGSYAARELIKMSGIVMPNFDNLPKLAN